MALNVKDVPRFNSKLVDELEIIIDHYLINHPGRTSVPIPVHDYLSDVDEAELRSRYLKAGWSSCEYFRESMNDEGQGRSWYNHYWILRH